MVDLTFWTFFGQSAFFLAAVVTTVAVLRPRFGNTAAACMAALGLPVFWLVAEFATMWPTLLVQTYFSGHLGSENLMAAFSGYLVLASMMLADKGVRAGERAMSRANAMATRREASMSGS